MSKLVFGMMQSLDGYVDGVAGRVELPPPDERLAKNRRDRSRNVREDEGAALKGFHVQHGEARGHELLSLGIGRRGPGVLTEQLLERVTGLYGVRPSIEFVQIAALVDNART